MRIRAREQDDLAEVERLLSAVGLPPDGLDRTRGWVLLEDDRIHGHIALECAGTTTVLRSLVVAKEQQGHGLGRALFDFAEAALAAWGPGLRVLRTDSIGDWVLRRGYRLAQLGELPAPVRGTSQFSGGLCAGSPGAGSPCAGSPYAGSPCASTPIYIKEN